MTNTIYRYLDISNANKTADFSCKINTINQVNFIIHNSGNLIDYSKFNSINIRITFNGTTLIFEQSLNSSNLKTIDGIQYIEWKVPINILQNQDKLSLKLTVRYNNSNVILKDFKCIVYKLDSAEMNAINTANRNLNSIIQTYLDSIKRSEIDAPNGLISLDSNGKIDKNKISFDFNAHIKDELIDTTGTLTQLHGLRINKNTYEVEYYDVDDDYWYVINSIHGGSFTKQNKESPKYDVFGGNFTDENPPEETNIFGGNF